MLQYTKTSIGRSPSSNGYKQAFSKSSHSQTQKPSQIRHTQLIHGTVDCTHPHANEIWTAEDQSNRTPYQSQHGSLPAKGQTEWPDFQSTSHHSTVYDAVMVHTNLAKVQGIRHQNNDRHCRLCDANKTGREIKKIFLQAGVTGQDLHSMNRFHMFLQAIFLSDICNGTGSAIDPRMWEGQTKCVSQYQ